MIFSEATFESAIIELFENMGYTHIYAPDMDRDYTSPLLDDELRNSLARLNKALPSDAIAVCKLKDFDGSSLVQKVKHAHYKKGRTCSSQILPFYFFYPVYFLISAVSTMNFTLPVSPLCKPLKVW